MKLLFVEKRRASGFPEALLGNLPATFERHREKNFLGDFLRLVLHRDGGLALTVAEVVELGTAD